MNYLNRFIFLVLIIAAGCGDKEIIEVGLHGKLTGTVYSSSLALVEGVKVTLEGSIPEISVTTGKDGTYTIEDLEMGTYHITFTKSGWGTYKILGYPFVGGEIPSTVNAQLYPLPDIEIKDVVSSVKKEYGSTTFSGTIYIDQTDLQSYGYYRYYFSNKADISVSKYVETGILTYYNSATSEAIFYKTLNTEIFPAGSDLYILIYPCTDQNSGYIDLETGKRIYASVSTKGSNVLSFKVPN